MGRAGVLFTLTLGMGRDGEAVAKKGQDGIRDLRGNNIPALKIAL